ncbi:MAG: zinc-dependent alcohol dehydrogenase family protein [Candidatus Rokubacteria bacterium]|nr:zinc-dependent alcohol dehydrogenase family protein [Candidatus Rokubacteria bacterium]MBI4629132.1 zinc-dependent alcohol dehydrogenase family protein [Candidatus Rokubacteria bacterium]
MRALALHAQAPIESAPLRLETRPVPGPGPDEVLVRVTACGVCRTDLHVVEGDLPLVRAPIVPGHQAVGRVEGAGAAAARFTLGERVGIAWLRRTCGACPFCASGRENLCERPEFTGWHADGGFADYAVVPEAFAYRIPPLFSDAEAAPLLCAGIIGYRALERSEVRPGGRLGIYGFGSSAHVTLQVARARGCEVYVCTREASHRELARRLGAAWVGDLPDAMPAKTDGTIVFAPAGELVPLALANLARGGTLALAGIHMTPVPPLDYERHLFYERSVRSVTANTRADGEALLAEAARIPIRPETTTFPLADANRALLALKRGEFTGSAVLLTG